MGKTCITIDEMIAKVEDWAELEKAWATPDDQRGKQRAEDCRQITSWLRELKEYKELLSNMDCNMEYGREACKRCLLLRDCPFNGTITPQTDCGWGEPKE